MLAAGLNMFHSAVVAFRLVCVTGLLLSLTLNGFDIDNLPSAKNNLKNLDEVYDLYPDYEYESNFKAYPHSKRFYKEPYESTALGKSAVTYLKNFINNKQRFLDIDKNEFGGKFVRNFVSKDPLSDDDFDKNLDQFYDELLLKNDLKGSANKFKGYENSYKIKTKFVEDNINGVKGEAKVDEEITQKTYNGSKPVVKVAKAHASATKAGKDDKWKIEPVESEYEIVTPNSDIESKGENSKKNDKDAKNGEAELEQIMMGDDYDSKAINNYFKERFGESDLFLDGNRKSNKKLAKENFVGKNQKIRMKRNIVNNVKNKTVEKLDLKKIDDASLLKKYIALQDAENKSLMRALNLASEIEFEQDEKGGDTILQKKLLQEQMKQMRKALTDEKALREIKQMFEENIKSKKMSNKKNSLKNDLNRNQLPEHLSKNKDESHKNRQFYIANQNEFERSKYLQNALNDDDFIEKRIQFLGKQADEESNDGEQFEYNENVAPINRQDIRYASNRNVMKRNRDENVMNAFALQKFREYLRSQGRDRFEVDRNRARDNVAVDYILKNEEDEEPEDYKNVIGM